MIQDIARGSLDALPSKLTDLYNKIKNGSLFIDHLDLSELEHLKKRVKNKPQALRTIEAITKLYKQSQTTTLPLHIHAKSQEAKLLQKDLETTSPDVVDKDGTTALIQAVKQQDMESIKALIRAGADVNFGNPPPLIAAVSGTTAKPEILDFLLTAGADPNVQDKNGKTALMFAADFGFATSFKILIDYGAALDLQDKDGWTALWFAATNGFTDICKTLLDKGADPTILDNQTRPIQLIIKALKAGDWQETKRLIKSKATTTFLDFSRLLKRTKITTHAFEMEGKGMLFGKQIPFEGGISALAARTMAKSCSKNSDLQELAPLLEKAADLRLPTKIDEQFIILTGFSGHAVSVLIWDDLFITCDRGGSQKDPLTVKRFDRTKLDLETVSLISKAKSRSKDDYKKLMNDILPKKLDFKSDDETKKIQKQSSLPFQIVGNCSWAANEGIIKTYLVIKNPKTAEASFMRWQVSQQMDLLEKYLKDPIDREIVYQSFNTLWLAKRYYGYAVDTSRLEKLEALYLKGKPSKEIRVFRINKTVAKLLPFRIPLRFLQGIISALALLFTTGRIRLERHHKETLPLKANRQKG